MNRTQALFAASAVCASLALASPAAAETFDVSSGQDLVSILENLQAGDEVIVGAGTYETGGFVEVNWAGTAAEPISVRAAEGARPIIQGVSSQNVLNIDGSHFELVGFEITGGSHGLRLGTVDNALFDNLVIHDVGDVGLSCNRPGTTCDRIAVRNTEIYNTGAAGGVGEGMYIGCNDGACTVSNSVFERNYIHDLGGTQGDGIEIKTGSWGNVVRDNVIIGANYPAITMYGFPDGAGPRNIVEGNFVQGTTDNGIQLVGQVIVRNNIVLDSGANGIASKASQGYEPHAVEIVHNTVVGAGDSCLRANDWGGQTGQVVANNALYCGDTRALQFPQGIGSDALFTNNVHLGTDNGPGGGGSTAGLSLMDELPGIGSWNAYPDGALLDAGAVMVGVMTDFDGKARATPPDVGALERTEASNPGWLPEADFKVVDGGAVPPLDDAGSDTGMPSDVTTAADTGVTSDVIASDAADITETSVADPDPSDAVDTQFMEPGAPPDTSSTPDQVGSMEADSTSDSGCCTTVRSADERPAPIAPIAIALLGLGWVALRRRR